MLFLFFCVTLPSGKMPKFQALWVSWVDVSEPKPLDYYYAKPRPWSGAAIAALIVGLCSGPASLWIAGIETSNHLDQSTKDIIVWTALVVCHAASLVFSASIYPAGTARWSPRPKTGDGRDHRYVRLGSSIYY